MINEDIEKLIKNDLKKIIIITIGSPITDIPNIQIIVAYKIFILKLFINDLNSNLYDPIFTI